MFRPSASVGTTPVLPGSQPVIYDAVTLQHFSAVNRLDILQELHGHRPTPRWTDEVHNEVLKGRNHNESKEWCDRLASTSWLGTPTAPNDLVRVMRFRSALGSTEKNLGEAESMVLAIEIGAIFVTDDRGAFDFAARNQDLGRTRVLDSCALLKLAEGQGYLTADESRAFHVDVADVSRFMRCNCTFH